MVYQLVNTKSLPDLWKGFSTSNQLFQNITSSGVLELLNRHQQFKISNLKATYTIGVTVWPEMLRDITVVGY